MMVSRPAFINDVQQRLLARPLPGEAAHLRMAHAVRRADAVYHPAEAKDAAVLITLYEAAPDVWNIIFIKRTSLQKKDKHAGQVAFPGGKKDQGDPDLMYTALREAEEEIGIDLSGVDILGPLTPMYITVSKFLVHPFLAYSWKKPVLSKQDMEIEDILELPLHSFLETDAKKETRIRLSEGIILNHVPAFQINGHIIWGATAMMLNEFIELIQD